MKNNNINNRFIVCWFWLASMFALWNFAYAQTDVEVYAPVEILMADPEITSSSVSLVLFEQAKKLHDGDGVAQDFLKARELYLRAAQMGSNDAKVNLGYLYFMGEGVGQDYEKARNWYLSAAKNGSKDAQLNLAMIYHNGFGVPKDNTQARYWRTYGQVKPIYKKPVVKVSKKSPVIKKFIEPKLVANQVKTSQPSTNVVQQVIATEPKTIVAQTNKTKPEIEPISEITEEPVIFIAQATQNIPNSLVSIPQAQTLTAQAKDGLTGISGTIAALNKENVLPAPIRTLRNRPRLDDKGPQILSLWISTGIAVIMLALVIYTSIWFLVQYTKIGKQKKAHVFARAFYAHHRDRLRINYLHYPEKHRKIEEIDDSWAAVLCVLMVKFAQSQKDEETLVGMQSNKIMQALAESPLKAKLAVFPFVKITQRRIFDDIEAHECNFNDENESDDASQAEEHLLKPESEQSTEVKLQSDSNEKQTPLLKENTPPDITE